MDRPQAGLARRVAVGAGWMLALRWCDRLLGMASIAVLARLLTPEAFGLVACAMLASALLAGLAERVPQLVLARTAEASALAHLGAARDIAELGGDALRGPMRAALFPGLARIADDALKRREALVEAIGIIVLLVLPVPLGIFLVAREAVALLLEPPWGAVGAAAAIAAGTAATLVADYLLCAARLRRAPRRFAAATWRPLVAAAAMVAVVLALRVGLPPAIDALGHAANLAACAATGAAIYVACVLLLWRLAGTGEGAERRLLTLPTMLRPTRAVRP